MIAWIKQHYQHASPARKITSSFLLVILTGAVLLWLPISNQNGQFLSFVDALFTATSATCVTGLVTVTTASQYTIFGKIVIMLLIQIGGLGLMTLMALLVLVMRNRLSMKEKLAMQEMLNKNNIYDMRTFLHGIIKYTTVFEGIGFVVLMLRLVPDFGLADGIFQSLFLSVSAFCNAGFDCIGDQSLIPYSQDIVVNVTIMALIVLGGIGFAVWFDVRDKIKDLVFGKISLHKAMHSLSLHTKIVLIMTSILIFGGAILFLLLERNNPNTFGEMSLHEMILPSMLQSVTLRTAGFASMDLGNTMMATKFLMLIWMFIGGSPGGTAGGIKTTTFFVLILFIFTMLKGKENIVVFRRTISKGSVIRATNIFTINLMTLFTGIFLLCMTNANLGFANLCFEAVSAMATVGLTLGITASLNVIGKIIVIMLMFIGRIGITTLLLSLIKFKTADKEPLVYPNGTILIG